MRAEKTTISLNKVRLFAFHGALPQERLTGGWYTLNVSVDYPFEAALSSDELADTLSYAGILAVVKREMAVPSRLLEHVAGRILSALFAAFPRIERGEIEIIKENPPIGSDTTGAAVILRAANDKDIS